MNAKQNQSIILLPSEEQVQY